MTRVAIVGAGCAGLAAAATLLEKSNAEVWMFEALGRIGGRTWTHSESLPVDHGAEAIESPSTNPWFAIATELGVGMVPSDQEATLYRVFDDGAWSSEGNTVGIGLVDAVLEEGYEQRRESPNRSIIGSEKNWGETPPQMVSLALGSTPLGSIKESAEPWQFVAADMYRQEKLSKPDDLEPRFVKGGVGALVAEYARTLGEKYGERLKIRTNAPVDAVDCRTGRVTTEVEHQLVSDYCIVTVPVSTIHKIAFTPPFSDERAAAYRTVRLGSYKKVGFRPTAPPNGDDDKIERGRLYYVYDDKLDGSWQYSWLPSEPDILLCVASGNFAARLDQMEGEDVLKLLLVLLKSAHPSGDFTPKLGADQQPQVAITNWSRQPFVLGAYSYTGYDGGDPEDPAPLKARELIAEPIERAYFAGEATWIANYGTIAGAYLSGQRAAAALIKDYGLGGVQ